MYFCKPLVAAALLAGVSVAAPAPAPAQEEGTSFKIGRPGPNGRVKDGKKELERAFAKWGFQLIGHNALAANPDTPKGTPGDEVSKALGSNSTVGTVKTNPKQGGALFITNVNVNGKQFAMDLDTGSSDMWLFSDQLGAAQQGQHSILNTKDPNFKLVQGGKFDISYGDGSAASGPVGTGTVDIGGVTVSDQAIGAASSVSASFVQENFNDGLMGLAFNSINTVTVNGQKKPQKTFFFNAKNKLKKGIFTADLEPDNGGTYEFGNVDLTRIQGKLANIPVNPAQGFWQFDNSEIQVNGQKVNVKGGPAIADTGTSLMLVNTDAAIAYYKQVKGAQFNQQVGGFIFPCNANLPDFGVGMGPNGHIATVPGKDIIFNKLNQNVCFGGIQSNAGAGIQILGDTFFNSQLVVFDGDNTQLQVAPKKGP
jgi:hypothetical protein